jgi:hypothetical protein
MARFYGSITGSRGEATRQGTPSRGLTSHIRGGWDVGVRVRCCVNREGADEIRVELTSGSSGEGLDRLIGTYTEADIKK